MSDPAPEQTPPVILSNAQWVQAIELVEQRLGALISPGWGTDDEQGWVLRIPGLPPLTLALGLTDNVRLADDVEPQVV